ncbi:MAG: rRNA pseudouridine synthase [Paludibacter sp.]|nr:rRNA pseudouridine synthase [Paludibacter sp.]
MNTESNHNSAQENQNGLSYNQNSDYRREGNNQYQRRSNYNQTRDNYQPRSNYNQARGNSSQPRRNFNDNGEGYAPRRNYNNPQRNLPEDYGNRWEENRDGNSNNQWRNSNNNYNNRQSQSRPRFNSNRPQQQNYSQRPNSFQPNNFQPRQNFGNRDDNANSNANYTETRFGNTGGGGAVRFRKPYRKTADYDPNAKYSRKKQIEFQQEYFDPTKPVRLNKYLANTGICSRREADEYIQAGVISVNGDVVTALGTKIMPTDSVKFHDQSVQSERKVYILLNKPKDCVTTTEDPNAKKNVMDIVRNSCSERIYPVGRLDRNTTGVLLLTNDGDLASKLAHPKFDKKKVYQVTLNKPLLPEDFRTIMLGVELEDGTIAADALEYANIEDKTIIGIEIHSGKNRIVRRIFEKLDYKVKRLDRVMFAGLTKKNLPRGKYRFLSEQEIAFLKMGNF